MTPLPTRLNQALWAAEWPGFPEGTQFGEGAPSAPGRLLPALTWAWQASLTVVNAINGSGEPQNLDKVHRFFDDLENWSAHHRAHMTWPPTAEGFVRAMRYSVDNKDERVIPVLLAYPAFCVRMLATAQGAGPKTVEELLSSWLIPSPPIVEAKTQPSVDTARKGAPPVRNASKRETASPRFQASDKPAATPHLTSGAGLLVKGWLDNASSIGEAALAREALDQTIKNALQKQEAWSWFDRELFPALVETSVEDIRKLLLLWPNNRTFSPADPLAFVQQTRFWALLRDAGDERRQVLMEEVLPKLVDGDSWDSSQRLAMLKEMLPRVAGRADAFEQRAKLWLAWGGSLDAPVIAEGAEGAESDSFTVTEPETAKGWIESRNDAAWNTRLSEMTPPTPSRSPKF